MQTMARSLSLPLSPKAEAYQFEFIPVHTRIDPLLINILFPELPPRRISVFILSFIGFNFLAKYKENSVSRFSHLNSLFLTVFFSYMMVTGTQ